MWSMSLRQENQDLRHHTGKKKGEGERTEAIGKHGSTDETIGGKQKMTKFGEKTTARKNHKRKRNTG